MENRIVRRSGAVVSQFDFSAADVGNIVALEHVNICIGDQLMATTFYITGLGLTRDPYLNTGTGNMWVNVGCSQFHLPSRPPQVLRGTTVIVIPGREKLLARLESVQKALEGTRFAFEEKNDHVAVVCPWGNRIRIHEPGSAFGPMQLGMPAVEFDVPVGSASGIARFYETILSAPGEVSEVDGAPAAYVSAGEGQTLSFRETDSDVPDFDGHHVAIYIADFSGPYGKLLERGLISQEDNPHQYRFIDIVDLDGGDILFQVEHEVRSMRHAMYARPLVNRNPLNTVMDYRPGHEDMAWTTPPAG